MAAALPAADATARIVSAAQALMTTLDDSGRAKLQFPFDGPQKTRWSNLPTGIFERKGLRMGDLSAAQRAAVTNLLTAALSRDGYRKVTEIIGGDEALHKANAGPPGGAPPGGNRVIFGEDEYYLAFLGTPSTTAPWMLQFGGHHLAINLTMAGSQSSMTPSLPATQPARYTVEGREIRPLGAENDKAFALINALDASQRSKAILTYGVSDLVLGPGQRWADDPARRHSRVRALGLAADDAARPGPRVGGHRHRRLRRAAHGRDQGDIAADLLRVERPDDERQHGVLPDPGADAGDRVRATAQPGSHPHDLPRSDQ